MALFSSNVNEQKNYIDQANKAYTQGMQQAMGSLQGYQQAGEKSLKRGYGAAIGLEVPYIKGGANIGKQALTPYMGSLGLGGPMAQQSAVNEFHASPEYQYAVQQAIGGTEATLASTGQTESGAEQKELSRDVQSEANKEYSQWQNHLGSLANIAFRTSSGAAERASGLSAQVGSSLANLGERYGSQVSGIYEDEAQAAAEAQLAKAKIDAEQQAGWLSLIGAGVGAAGAIGGDIFAANLMKSTTGGKK